MMEELTLEEMLFVLEQTTSRRDDMFTLAILAELVPLLAQRVHELERRLDDERPSDA